MQIKTFLSAIALAAVASTSFAASGTAMPFDADGISTYYSPSFSGGSISDTISFSGLAAGKYDVSLDFSGLQFTLTDLTLNGVHADSITNTTSGKSKYSFAFLDTSATSPFTLNIFGNGVAGKAGSYTGSLSAVAAVPEPETYAMMLAGLVGIGFMSRRRKFGDR